MNLANPKITPNTGRVGDPNIERSALLARLERARDGRVTILQAPAGYGKSRLIRSWTAALQTSGVTVALVSIDEDLADPIQFLNVLTVAIAEATARTDLHSTEIRDATTLRFAARRIGRLLQKSQVPLVIIFDDYDRASNDELDTVIGELVFGLPAHVHSVFASRSQLNVPLSTLWFDANVVQFGQRDLRFSDAEIAALFEHRLTEQELAHISVWTEGWPVAVQLARQYRATCRSDRELEDIFKRADGNVAQYLTEQVLSRLPKQHRELLVQCSFLEEFSVDLVEAVTKIRPAWPVLQELQNSNVLIAPMDSGDGWYRCHHLLRQVMLAQLRKRGRGALAELQRAASNWFYENNHLRAAVRYAVASGDFDLAVKLILDAGGIFYGIRYGVPALRLLMTDFPLDVIRRYPRLSLAQVAVLVKKGQLDVATDILKSIKLQCGNPSTSEKRTRDPLLHRDIAMAEVMIAFYSGIHIGRESMNALELAARQAPAEAFWLHGIVHNILCITKYRESDFAGASKAANSALYYYGQVHSSNGAGHMHLDMGLFALEGAEPAAALQNFQKAHDAFEDGLCGDEAGCAIADLLMAEAFYEQGRLSEAQELCGPALELVESGESHYESLISGYRTLAALTTLNEGPQAAISLVDRGISWARQHFTELERYLSLLRHELELDVGGCTTLAAGAELTSIGTSRSPQSSAIVPWWEGDIGDRIGAREALQSGDTLEAIGALERMQMRLERSGRKRNCVRVLVQLAIAYDRNSERAKAIDSVRHAMRIARPGGLVMPFVEQRRYLAPFLARLVAGHGAYQSDQEERSFIKEILQISNRLDALALVLFSDREREIVNLLAQDTNNKTIARSLGISPETVRFHLKNIYGKLGVSDRRAAALLAQELGMSD